MRVVGRFLKCLWRNNGENLMHIYFFNNRDHFVLSINIHIDINPLNSCLSFVVFSGI